MHGNLMYVKLALCNVRRTAKDYLIYGITLILSIGMFYGFYSLGSPYYSATLPVRMHLSILRQVMRFAVPLVGLLSVFLISYVNAYMFRQKQKEFAVESILGMEQGTVAVLFFLETLSMGAAAVILGILLGVLLSQGISILVVQSFGEIYRLHFTVFPDTLLGTILFFGLPVLAALIGSAGVLAYLVWSGYRTITAYISLGQIGHIFAGVYTVFMLILGRYFTATYSSVCASVSRSA